MILAFWGKLFNLFDRFENKCISAYTKSRFCSCGRHVYLGKGSVFTPASISVGDNVYIGNNVILLPGVTVGNNVIIGAGAVVSRDIPDNSVAVGVPARVIKTADEYFEKIQKESLHLGHLKGQEKDKALMEYYGYKGKSKGIYF